MNPFEQTQPSNSPERIPGFIPEETPEQRRRGIETFEPGEKQQETSYTGERPAGFMGEKETTEQVGKENKFASYRDKIKNASIDKLNSFISWCEEGMDKDKDYKEKYRDLQKEAAELILSKIKVAKAGGTMQLGQALRDINALKNVFNFRIDEISKEQKEAQAAGNELGARRSQNLANKYRELILQAEDLEKMIRT